MAWQMVDGGWYFCPTEDSNDLASCAYCKLSLDGWEPKDDPFDEHYRRSSDCSFFVFAQPPGKKTKGSRSKKPRGSKASRLSTQSTVSETPVSDIDQIDQSEVSQSTTKSKGTKKSKAKAKTRAKKEEVEEVGAEMDVDAMEYTQPKRTTRGKKRASGEVATDKDEAAAVNTQETEHSEAPTKKKAKNSRESIQNNNNQNDVVIVDTHQDEIPQEEESSRGRGATKKKTSKGRKASTESSAAKTTSKSRVPQDSELDAGIEAGLEADLVGLDLEKSNDEEVQKPAKKAKSKKKKETPESSVAVAHQPEAMHPSQEPETAMPPVTKVSQTMSTEEPVKRQRSGGSKSSEQITRRSADPNGESETKEGKGNDAESVRHESFVSVEIRNVIPENPPAKPDDKGTKQKKKNSAEKGKKPKKTEKHATEPVGSEGMHIERQNEMQEMQEQEPSPEATSCRSSRVPPKTAERYSDIPEEKQFARSIAESRDSDTHVAVEDTTKDDNDPVSPLPSASKSTPSLSPQSSDAENRPPSMRVSAPRPILTSPSKQPVIRVPLAPSTPSPSKRDPNIEALNTSYPWRPVDIDKILLAGNIDKENVDIASPLVSMKGDLTSPEKKMSVEQWIMWNAKNGEERLKRECERLVGQFEREGARAMHVLEGIECVD
ncbi:hypothetical protein EYZ11_000024 [Aspergillus tanneri]|uniref:Uncharacterized protein n=1 Tax=Aspergillus tanneri TaxID=1220188 RepID=A0A4S3JY26_9EURO|nr:hypothetical protein EYZ11_000024 [Aspergillus tanneri]